MPVPMWIAQINKRVLNPRELKKGARPVLIHVGRSSGRTYQTPLDAHPIEGGYIFIVMYGATSDWVQNVLASHGATLRIDGEDHELDSPRIISKVDAFRILPEGTKPPAEFLKVTEYLQMDVRRSQEGI